MRQVQRMSAAGFPEREEPNHLGSEAYFGRISPEVDVVLSFDVESHARIEAARGLPIGPTLREVCDRRIAPATSWILDILAERGVLATFFILGEVALGNPSLVRSIHRAGHEVASHGWDHRRVLAMTPDEFRCDLERSKDSLEQITGEAVVGYRAPTFSITRKNPWAIDVLVESGFLYDSSIFPVRHDRYGVPDAPRFPFRARGQHHTIIELPPATLQIAGTNLPVGGGGYFRLLPPMLLRRAVRQLGHTCQPSIATIYLHPWELDPGHPRLPLRGISRFRTYVGTRGNRERFAQFIGGQRLVRAVEVVKRLEADDLVIHPNCEA